MAIMLRWKKGLFSGAYRIYSGDKQSGTLTDKSFFQSARGDLNGKRFIFRTKGLLKQHTEIIDPEVNRMIGKISYNSWMTKATITLHEKTVNWQMTLVIILAVFIPIWVSVVN
jgi:hypothetical protein